MSTLYSLGVVVIHDVGRIFAAPGSLGQRPDPLRQARLCRVGCGGGRAIKLKADAREAPPAPQSDFQ
jgi:hypothetical protein